MFLPVPLQNEDKQFKPVKEVEGPLLALTHVVKKSDFPHETVDILIAFLTK